MRKGTYTQQLVETEHRERQQRDLEKRKNPNEGVPLYQSVLKKPRMDMVPFQQNIDLEKNPNVRIVKTEDDVSSYKRTSNLNSPTMLLEGHEGHIYTVKFSPDGELLASAGHDKDIFIWNVYGDCKNTHLLRGHRASVLEICWSSDGDRIISASADKTAGVWDASEGVRIKKCREHKSFVNSVSYFGARDPSLFLSGSDDGTIKVWDSRLRSNVQSFSSDYPILTVDYCQDLSLIFGAGLDEIIRAWDIRKSDSSVYSISGHTDSITSIRVSNDGDYLLSNSMDQTMIMWDIRPFLPESTSRFVKRFIGHKHGSEQNLLRSSWNPNNTRVSSGSADENVYIWDVDTEQVIYLLPGHNGSVNEVGFHPKEPIIVSGGSDNKIFLGELFN